MFKIALLTGIGVGGSTFVGSLIAFFVKKLSHKATDTILGFAAGIMLGATIFSLIIPSIEAESSNLAIVCIGILLGAITINLFDKVIPHMHKLVGIKDIDEKNTEQLNKILLFVIAIAIHNFPEGLAVGVSFSGDNIKNAFAIALGISLQNIPEGAITILPLVLAGISRKKAIIIALATGFTEVLGVIIGFFAISILGTILPFVLAFAGGTMMYVISHDMIPESHSHNYENHASYALIFGFIVMLCIERLL